MRLRWEWVSLPLLTGLAACTTILGYGDFKKVDEETTKTDSGTSGGTTGSGSSSPTSPTSTSTTTPPNTCSNGKPWGTPQLVANVSTGNIERGVTLSADELTLAVGTSTNQTTANIATASRTAANGTFGAPSTLTSLRSGNQNYDPSLSADGLTLYFDALDSRNSFFVLYRATRTAGGVFGNPVQLPSANASNVDNLCPVITADGNELFMLHGDPSTSSARSIWHSVKSGTDFPAAEQLTELPTSTTGDVTAIALSSDRLTLYFSSNLAGGQGGTDIWMATRASTSSVFIQPTLVTALNSTSDDEPGWVSADNCRFYMSSTRTGSGDVYVATRTP